MPKLKTHKSVSERFKIKRSKKGIKVIKRTCGQDHFNARENGNTLRNKRSDTTINSAVKKTILRAMPN